MKRVFRTVPCSVLATAVLLSWNSIALSGPDAGEAPPGQDRPREGAVLRMEEMIIHGNADDPGVLYLLPRAETPLLPLVAGPAERKESILRDTKDQDDISPSDESRGNSSNPEQDHGT